MLENPVSSPMLNSDDSAQGSLSRAGDYTSFRKEADRAKEDGLVPLILSPDPSVGNTRQLSRIIKKFDSTAKPEKLGLINALSVNVDSRKLKNFINQLPEGARVHVNRELQPSPTSLFLENSAPISSPTQTSAQRLSGLSEVWEQGFKGQGQTIAMIDSGIFPHSDLKDKVVAWVDFPDSKAKPIDPLGHGTHVGGILVGNGKKSDGQICGVAPEADIAALRIGSIKDAINAMDWVIDNMEKYNIRVVNLSMGDKATTSYKDDPWAQAVQKGIDHGLVVVVAAGNKGEISTPGILPDAITVGAVDDRGTADTSDDVLASFSGQGPTLDGLSKPDVLAPGVGIFSTLSPGSASDEKRWPHIRKDYVAISGTSQAAPFVAGLAALMLQANPKLSAQQVKDTLMNTAHHYDNIADKAQGGGLIQADEAIAQALLTKGKAA
jgi:serine protease AprX